MSRQAVYLPRYIAERLQLAVDLCGLAYKLQAEWSSEDCEEDVNRYDDAAEHLKDAAYEIWEAVWQLVMLHHFEELDAEAAKAAKALRKRPGRGRG